MNMAKVKKQKKKNESISPFANYWERENYIFLAIGIIFLIVGFTFMAQGTWDNPLALSVSPVILLLGYLVFFPLSIFYKKKKSE